MTWKGKIENIFSKFKKHGKLIQTEELLKQTEKEQMPEQDRSVINISNRETTDENNSSF